MYTLERRQVRRNSLKVCQIINMIVKVQQELLFCLDPNPRINRYRRKLTGGKFNTD